jgi:hypothetical protein
MKRFAKVFSALRSRAAIASSEERLVRTKINGKPYSISSDDDYLDHVEGEFEPEMVSLFQSLLQPTDTVLDIGANIGCTSYCLETLLVRSTVLSRLLPPIDVEGFEQSVIEGLTSTILRDEPIVALELNHWCLNAFQRTSVPDFFDYLRSVFPYLYAVDMRYAGSLRDRIQRELLPFRYDKKDARNLHDQDAAYHVMYRHILHGSSYPTLVGAFKSTQLNALSSKFGIQLAGRE